MGAGLAFFSFFLPRGLAVEAAEAAAVRSGLDRCCLAVDAAGVLSSWADLGFSSLASRLLSRILGASSVRQEVVGSKCLTRIGPPSTILRRSQAENRVPPLLERSHPLGEAAEPRPPVASPHEGSKGWEAAWSERG